MDIALRDSNDNFGVIRMILHVNRKGIKVLFMQMALMYASIEPHLWGRDAVRFRGCGTTNI